MSGRRANHCCTTIAVHLSQVTLFEEKVYINFLLTNSKILASKVVLFKKFVTAYRKPHMAVPIAVCDSQNCSKVLF
jgi:hypothetical protein